MAAGSLLEVVPGNLLVSTWTPTPASGTISLADVSTRTIDPNGTITTVTGATGSTTFSLTFSVGDTAIQGLWTLRWEANSPSVHASYEQQYTVLPSPFGSSA